MCGMLNKVSINKQELDREKAARLDQEMAARRQAPVFCIVSCFNDIITLT